MKILQKKKIVLKGNQESNLFAQEHHQIQWQDPILHTYQISDLSFGTQ